MSSNPFELVRVKDPTTGAEFNATRGYARKAGLEVTNKPAFDKHGRAIPAKSNPLYQAPGVEGSDDVPNESWTNQDLDDYAAANGIDLAGAKNKNDKLAAITAAAETKES